MSSIKSSLTDKVRTALLEHLADGLASNDPQFLAYVPTYLAYRFITFGFSKNVFLGFCGAAFDKATEWHKEYLDKNKAN